MNTPTPITDPTPSLSESSSPAPNKLLLPTSVPIPVPTVLQINWNVIFLAAIAAVPPTIIAAATFFQSARTHDIVNSRMDEFKTLVIKSSGDAAVLKEKAEVAAKEDERKAAISSFVLPPQGQLLQPQPQPQKGK